MIVQIHDVLSIEPELVHDVVAEQFHRNGWAYFKATGNHKVLMTDGSTLICKVIEWIKNTLEFDLTLIQDDVEPDFSLFETANKKQFDDMIERLKAR